MDDETIDVNGGGLRLERMLEAYVASGWIHTLRDWFQRLVVAISIPVWVTALAPHALSHAWRAAVLVVWPVGGLGLAIAWIGERRCRRMLARSLEELGPRASSGS